jgi:DNA-binding PadR family transcriptional regulator
LRELHGLEAEGKVRVEVVPQDGKPARKVYELTELGRSQLRRWLEEPAEPLQLRDQRRSRAASVRRTSARARACFSVARLAVRTLRHDWVDD